MAVFTLAIHGGAGTIQKEDMTPELEKAYLKGLQEALDAGKVIVDISQCQGGSVELGKYETSKQLQQMGIISGYDMTFEATTAKLMFLLGKGLSVAEMRVAMEESLRGELSR